MNRVYVTIALVLAFILLPFCAKGEDPEKTCQVVGNVTFKLCAQQAIPDFHSGKVTRDFAHETCLQAGQFAYTLCKESLAGTAMKYDEMPQCVGSRSFVVDSVLGGAKLASEEVPKSKREASLKVAEKWALGAGDGMLYLCQNAKAKESAPPTPAKNGDTIDL